MRLVRIAFFNPTYAANTASNFQNGRVIDMVRPFCFRAYIQYVCGMVRKQTQLLCQAVGQVQRKLPYRFKNYRPRNLPLALHTFDDMVGKAFFSFGKLPLRVFAATIENFCYIAPANSGSLTTYGETSSLQQWKLS
jgi:hypothetical protein